MRIDLSQALHDAATTSTALRPGLAAGPVLRRIHRRRAAVVTAQSAVGIAAAGAVAVGGLQLTGRGDGEPVAPATPTTSATPTPTPQPSVAAVTPSGDFACGAPVPTIVDPAGESDLHLEPLGVVAPAPGSTTDPDALPWAPLDGLTLPEDRALALRVELVNGGSEATAFGAEWPERYRTWIAQDGVVVGRLGDPPGTAQDTSQPVLDDPDGLVDLVGGAGTRWSQGGGGSFLSCSATPLTAGDYDVYVEQVVTVYPDAPVDGVYRADASVDPIRIAGGPWRVALADAETAMPVLEPEPTPPVDPRPAAADLVITTAGLGPLTVGLPPEGNPGAAMIRFDREACLEHDPASLGEWEPVPAYEGVGEDGYPAYPFAVEANADGVHRIDVRSPEPATEAGIRIGSTPAELRAAYPTLAGPVVGWGSEVWTLADERGTLVFEVVTEVQEGMGVDRPGVVSIRVFAPGLEADFTIWGTDHTAGSCL